MCILFSFLPATIWVVVGYFVLFASTIAQDGLRTFGRLLGIWVLIVAAFFPAMGAYVTVTGFCPLERAFQAEPGNSPVIK